MIYNFIPEDFNGTYIHDCAIERLNKRENIVPNALGVNYWGGILDSDSNLITDCKNITLNGEKLGDYMEEEVYDEIKLAIVEGKFVSATIEIEYN